MAPRITPGLPLLTHNPEIVLGVLIEIFSLYAVATRSRVAHHGHIVLISAARIPGRLARITVSAPPCRGPDRRKAFCGRFGLNDLLWAPLPKTISDIGSWPKLPAQPKWSYNWKAPTFGGRGSGPMWRVRSSEGEAPARWQSRRTPRL